MYITGGFRNFHFLHQTLHNRNSAFNRIDLLLGLRVMRMSRLPHSNSKKEETLGCELEIDFSKNNGYLNVFIPSSLFEQKSMETNENKANKGANAANGDKKDASDFIPESVLQYERQLRKNQAAKRASAPLSKDQLNVLHDDKHIIVTVKPSGVLTVPGINSNPSLLSLVHQEFNGDIEDGMKMDQMIIHRLDMDTSGLVIFAKDKHSMAELQKSFRERDVQKEYEALVCGHLSPEINEGCIDLPLQRDHRFPPFMRVATPESENEAKLVVQELNHAGWKKIVKKNAKPSKTLFRVISREFVRATDQLKEILPVTRLQLTPITGRTHQLRVHCAAIGHPILGDPTYGILGEASPNGGFEDRLIQSKIPCKATIDLQLKLDKYVKEENKCMCLHARKLSLNHPILGQEMIFEVPPLF